MNNFKNKKTSLNTKINLSQEEPFILQEPQRVPVRIDNVEVFNENARAFNKMINSGLKNENMSDNKEKMYICIVDDCESNVGSILEIEKWLDDQEFDEDNNDIVMYELKSDKPLSCSFSRKTTIRIN